MIYKSINIVYELKGFKMTSTTNLLLLKLVGRIFIYNFSEPIKKKQ